MFSISFLPWLLLLLGIALSIPIVSYVEKNRQKRALAAAAAPVAAGEEEIEPEGEEVFGEEADAGFPSGEATPAEGEFGQGGFGQGNDPELAGFDDDAFK